MKMKYNGEVRFDFVTEFKEYKYGVLMKIEYHNSYNLLTTKTTASSAIPEFKMNKIFAVVLCLAFASMTLAGNPLMMGGLGMMNPYMMGMMNPYMMGMMNPYMMGMGGLGMMGMMNPYMMGYGGLGMLGGYGMMGGLGMMGKK
ncbi:hypothetical protein LOTGIDRAFT_232568 [Lottia gigantea]|uniref:Transmembrane protein n=1 Tax=Lottia gigantea TaxID=225164 RepID=V4AL91_LOTGI|nr:hypothetical protein LOTGIDRAFT_232568 [Lottia gigantea]ESO94341.1 hypothetical protein LOTGIDRAFT_232568 [Lottia gigantea]